MHYLARITSGALRLVVWGQPSPSNRVLIGCPCFLRHWWRFCILNLNVLGMGDAAGGCSLPVAANPRNRSPGAYHAAHPGR